MGDTVGVLGGDCRAYDGYKGVSGEGEPEEGGGAV